MNIPINSPQSLPEYLFRGADRMRIEGCVNAISREHLSLALFAEHEALLDHYAELLVQRLRRLGQDLQVEVYFPTNTESLLARFNEALADQSMATAVQNSPRQGPTQIWLVHDAQLLPAHELQLMARLIQNFPGANIRAILLVSGQGFDRELLSAFGRKILRWDIETPTPEQAQALLEQARAEGHGEAMDRLVRRLGRQQPPSIEALAEQAQAAQDLMAQVRTIAQTQDQRQSGKGTWLKASLQSVFAQLQAAGRLAGLRPSGSAGLTRWVLVGGGALLASSLIMAWLQPKAFGLRSQEPESLSTVPAVVPLTGPAAGVSLENQPATDTATPAPAEPPSPAPATATSVPAATGVPPPAQRKPADEAGSSPPRTSPAQSGEQALNWARGLNAGSFVIQYGSSSSYAGAQALQQRYPSLANARIVPITRAGERTPRYAVVSGPYTPSSQAYDKLRNLGNIVPGTSWVRRTSDLQASLATGRPQESQP